MTMSSQNQTNFVTQRVILSAAYSPTGSTNVASNTAGPSANRYNLDYHDHWQDTVPASIQNRSTLNATFGDTNALDVANEFELDVERITHQWQSLSAIVGMPGVAHTPGGDNEIRNEMQFSGYTVELGMMREIIDVTGILYDGNNHPSSTSGHHIRRQQMLDIARSQWANIHNFNRGTKYDWDDPNKFPALTIGPKLGMTAGDANRDSKHYGQEPSSDIRGREISGNEILVSGGSSASWDYQLNYKGRRRYRGVIRRLTLINVAGQPDIWRYQLSFEVIKNELEQRHLNATDPDKEDRSATDNSLWEKVKTFASWLHPLNSGN